MSPSLKVIVFLAFASISAVQVVNGVDPIHLPLTRRTLSLPLNLTEQARRVRVKYGSESPPSALPPAPVTRPNRFDRRDDGQSIHITDHLDGEYFTSISVGTPPQTLNVILDTGSTDLWVAGNECTVAAGCVAGTHLFNSSQSDTFSFLAPSSPETASNNGQSAVIVYGGFAFLSGTASMDAMSMAGFSIKEQVFVNVEVIDSNFTTTDQDISGLMGLGFTRGGVIEEEPVPFWLALANSSKLPEPEMSFYLARSNAPEATNVPGGMFTLGGTNPNLFTGNVEFLSVPLENLPADELIYWQLPVTEFSIAGHSLPSSSDGIAVFDTAVPYITGTTVEVRALWAAIPGSSPSLSSEGFYKYPCNTTLNVSLSFGGRSWPISEQDMNLGPDTDDPSNCLGAIVDGGASLSLATAVNWIVGYTFLNNVYSVFHLADPPMIGFAQLSGNAGGSVTSPGGSSGSGKKSDASIIKAIQLTPAILVLALTTFMVLGL